MKKLFFITPLLGVVITAMGCSTNSEQTGNQELTTQTALVEMQSKTINKNVAVDKFAELTTKKDGQILDVRTPEEWKSGTIKDAKKVNFFDKNFNEQLAELDKNKPVYVYCKSGGRSGKAAKQMEKMGFKTIYNLIGGMDAWKAAGKEVVK